MNCPVCGRFMKRGGYYANDHDDSWTDTWKCATRHPTPEQVARAKELVDEARRQNDDRKTREFLALFNAAREAGTILKGEK